MIGYYLNSGDQEGADMFNPYIWGNHGLDTLMKKQLNKNYGKDMKLLLILYYLEGQFSNYLPLSPELGNYMKSTMDIKVSIGVTRDLFHNRDEFERREFIVDSTLNAINLVKKKFIKKKLDIDFDRLISDVKDVAHEYLKYPKPYVKE